MNQISRSFNNLGYNDLFSPIRVHFSVGQHRKNEQPHHEMAKVEATIRMQLELHHRISRLIENMKNLGKEKITSIIVKTRLEALET